jgi:hypothetical protein
MNRDKYERRLRCLRILMLIEAYTYGELEMWLAEAA